MEGKKGGHPPSEATRDTEPPKEDKKKGPNWPAASFAINVWRAVRDWVDHQ
jgi:hypothetical protein